MKKIFVYVVMLIILCLSTYAWWWDDSTEQTLFIIDQETNYNGTIINNTINNSYYFNTTINTTINNTINNSFYYNTTINNTYENDFIINVSNGSTNNQATNGSIIQHLSGYGISVFQQGLNFMYNFTLDLSLYNESAKIDVLNSSKVDTFSCPDGFAVQNASAHSFDCINVSTESIPNHNNLTGLQGGSSNQYYHLNNTIYTYLLSNIYTWVDNAVNNLINYYNKTEVDTFLETKLNITDQRYNESAKIDALNSSKASVGSVECPNGYYLWNVTLTNTGVSKICVKDIFLDNVTASDNITHTTLFFYLNNGSNTSVSFIDRNTWNTTQEMIDAVNTTELLINWSNFIIDTSKEGGNPYLYNDSTTIYLNESILNITISKYLVENTFWNKSGTELTQKFFGDEINTTGTIYPYTDFGVDLGKSGYRFDDTNSKRFLTGLIINSPTTAGRFYSYDYITESIGTASSGVGHRDEAYVQYNPTSPFSTTERYYNFLARYTLNCNSAIASCVTDLQKEQLRMEVNLNQQNGGIITTQNHHPISYVRTLQSFPYTQYLGNERYFVDSTGAHGDMYNGISRINPAGTGCDMWSATWDAPLPFPSPYYYEVNVNGQEHKVAIEFPEPATYEVITTCTVDEELKTTLTTGGFCQYHVYDMSGRSVGYWCQINTLMGDLAIVDFPIELLFVNWKLRITQPVAVDSFGGI